MSQHVQRIAKNKYVTLGVGCITVAAFIVCVMTLWRSVIAQEQEIEIDIPASQAQQAAAPVVAGDGVSVFVGIPVQLRIPAIGVRAAIDDVGVSKRGTMAVPDSYSNVGWYRYGPRPGQPGSAVIDGHVDNGVGLPAVFGRLDELKVGDTVEILDDAGNTFVFIVAKTDVVPYTSSTKEVFAEVSSSRLNLITCSGRWDADEEIYSDRLIVYTELADVRPAR